MGLQVFILTHFLHAKRCPLRLKMLRAFYRDFGGRNWPQALADCSKSLELRPNEGSVLRNRGLVELRLGAFDNAIADYGAALAQDAEDAYALYGRGLAKKKSGDPVGATPTSRLPKQLRPTLPRSMPDTVSSDVRVT